MTKLNTITTEQLLRMCVLQITGQPSYRQAAIYFGNIVFSYCVNM